ncbi:MAG: GNAT family N-acetyltransferase [Alphaproteobacteria bacterium]|nr:GNAT family N-acetyltransferase [Alphaproteobacteria bacterium]
METSRLIIRRWSDDDAENLYLLFSDVDVASACGVQPHSSINYSRHIISDYFSQEPFTFAIELKMLKTPVGMICLKPKEHSNLVTGDDELEFSFWLGKKYWGQKIIIEAGNYLIKYAFKYLKKQKITAKIYAGNDRAWKVLKNLGFKYQYTRKNIEVPALEEKRDEHIFLLNAINFAHKI